MKKNCEDERRIENIFLAYANYDLRGKPENLYKIFDVIKYESGDENIFKGINKIIECICDMTKEGFAININTERYCEDKTIDIDRYNFAKKALSTWGDCAECKSAYPVDDNFDKNLLSEKEHLHCFECQQILFKKLLSDIAIGVSYDSISKKYGNSHLGDISYRAYERIRPWYYVYPKDGVLHKQYSGYLRHKYGHQFEVYKLAGYALDPFYEGVKDYNFNLNQIILDFASYSLMEFLTEKPKNRELLKICGDCGKFFIATKFDSRIKKCQVCSPKSRKPKEVERLYKRHYRADERRRKETMQRLEMIERIMQGGHSRAEAEKIFEDDRSLKSPPSKKRN